MTVARPFRLTAKQEEQIRLAARVRFMLAYGGSRSGKTFGYCHMIAVRALKAAQSRHLIYRKTLAATKSAFAGPNGTMTEVLARRFPDLKYKYHKQDGIWEFPEGQEILMTGLDDHNLEKVLGTEYATIFGNELSETPFSSWELIRSRLAQTVEMVDGTPLTQRFFGDLNPTTRAHWTYRVWQDLVDPSSGKAFDPDLFAWIQMNPRDNEDNLDKAYLADLMSLGERARKRFWDGEYAADVEEALWRRAMILRTSRAPEQLRRIVVAVDPSISNTPGSDETGIITAGIDENQIGYVLADDSGKMRAEDWARRALAAYYQFEADCIVAEVNQGGDLVENQIRAMVLPGQEQPSIRKVHATRGKYVRAEPIAALYERQKVYHVGEHPELEDQMCLIAGTLVETQHGQVPIEQVTTADRVMTRRGHAPLRFAGKTATTRSLIAIKTNSGREIVATRGHPIWTQRGFVSAANVLPGEILLESPEWANTDGPFDGIRDGITARRPATTATPKENCSTELSGKHTSARFLAAITSTIGMVIQAITDPRIWLASLPLSTRQSMSRVAGMQTDNLTLIEPGTSRALHGRRVQPPSDHAHIAEQFSRVSGLAPSIAASHAVSARDQWRRSQNDPVSPAGRRSEQETRDGSIVASVVTIELTTPVSVYNLSVVEGFDPEFFANGYLTHNCSFTADFDRKAAGFSPDRVDALVWAASELFGEMTKQKRKRQPVRPRPNLGGNGWMAV